MKKKYRLGFIVALALVVSLLFTLLVSAQIVTDNEKGSIAFSSETEKAQREYEEYITGIIKEKISVNEMIYRINSFLLEFDKAKDFVITTSVKEVLIGDEEYDQISIDISNVSLGDFNKSSLSLMADTEIVSLVSRSEYAPYGDSQICPYYSVRAYIEGKYSYYYSNGERKVCPYSISGSNTIYDTSFSVVSQNASSTYTAGGYTIGDCNFPLGGYTSWGPYDTGFTQYVTANEYTWLKVSNIVLVKRGSSFYYYLPVMAVTHGYN